MGGGAHARAGEEVQHERPAIGLAAEEADAQRGRSTAVGDDLLRNHLSQSLVDRA